MAKKKIAALKFYANIGMWGVTALGFTNEFEALAVKHDEVLIRTHSYGGSVIEGNVIYNAILQAEVRTVFQIDGIAASMMGLVMLAGDWIKMVDNGFVMIHAPMSSMGGNATQLENEAKLLRNMETNAIKRIVERTGKSEADVKLLFDGNDHWFSAKEALEYGLVDEIIPATVKNVKALNVEMVETLGVETIYNRFAASLTKPQSSNNNKNSIQMKKLLIDTYKLEGVTEDSSDGEILAAMEKQNGAVAQKLKDLEAQAKAERDAAIKAALDTAETQRGKKFDEKTREALVQVGEKAGIEALHLSLGVTATAAQKPTVPNVVSMLSGKTASEDAQGRDAWDFDKWMQEDPEAFEQMAETDYDKFNAVYKKKYKVDAPR